MTSRSTINYVKSHPSGKVKIAYSDIDGILRGKYISTEKFLAIVDGGSSFCDVIFGWDSSDVAYDNTLIHRMAFRLSRCASTIRFKYVQKNSVGK